MKRRLFVFLQCTWGGLATLIGFIFYIANRGCGHNRYRSCIDTKWNAKGGLSLGLFIFTPKDEAPNSQKIRVHEYGHSVQNLILGPLMLFVGIISVAWGNLPYFARKRKQNNLPYTACFVEAWASRWGEAVTGEDAVWQ